MQYTAKQVQKEGGEQGTKWNKYGFDAQAAARGGKAGGSGVFRDGDGAVPGLRCTAYHLLPLDGGSNVPTVLGGVDRAVYRRRAGRGLEGVGAGMQAGQRAGHAAFLRAQGPL